ncbi:hypothetical protein [Gelidibacter sp. F63206]|uniref:hypothetical protein n=1 Tax=Gelidibacter sp. F63206 TaxID=2926425 RepID=UPI001FF1AEC6|nr:hypothetical protein [Gelidibacter sp. F63206]MCK0115283.1 hypothetical protein [Gelidibacter sp. F63206]
MYRQQKKGNSEGAMGSKSKMNLMKSYKNIKRKAAPKQNNQPAGRQEGKRSRYNK